VDDAKPFGREIEELDLSVPGYKVSVTIDSEDVGQDDEWSDEDEDDEDEDDEDEDDEAEDDEAEDDEAEGDGCDETESTSSELTVCLWAFLDGDLKLIYAVSGRVYRLSGDDESKLQTLRELSRHDFHSVGRSSVPNRFCVRYTNGSQKQGFAPPDAVSDPSAMLFEELLNELEQQLPPLADFARDTQTRQKLPGDPLSVRTVVYEDAHGNCRAIVDKEDKTWLLRQMQ
jgi:hypothetical protein